MKAEICNTCRNVIHLSEDNIGMSLNYYGTCKHCGTRVDINYDVKTKKQLSKKWFPPLNEE